MQVPSDFLERNLNFGRGPDLMNPLPSGYVPVEADIENELPIQKQFI